VVEDSYTTLYDDDNQQRRPPPLFRLETGTVRVQTVAELIRCLMTNQIVS